MRSALIATASFASVLVVFGAAATAHEMAATPAKPAAHCPAPKPAAKPAHRRARPPCPGARHAANRHDGHHGRRFASGRSVYDNGVAPSQAFVYGEEKERERRDRRREVYAAAPVPPPCAHACPPADHRLLDHHPFMSQGGAHSWSSERRETEAGGFVRGERDGRGYGWSWGGGARGCEPCSRHAEGARFEGYRYAGRDRNGYLVWPGKTPGW